MAEELPDSFELNDPRALRALAHPTRLRLVGLLRQEGPLTATQAGEKIGQSAASCSFHFRQLAKWGLVTEAEGGKGREHPWKATASHTSWKVNSPEMAGPAAALEGLVARHQFEQILESIERRPEERPAWQRAVQFSDTVLQLTPEELEEMGSRVWQIVRSYTEGRGDGDRRRIGVFFAAFPLREERA